MLQKSGPAFCILLLLSGIGIAFLSYLLPFCPPELCLGTTYAAYALEQGHSSYPAFVYHTLKTASVQKKETTDPLPQKAPVFTTTNTPEVTDLNISDVSFRNETEYPLDFITEAYAPPAKKTEKPQILIVHTHATESYAGTDNRSTDTELNMVSIGNVLAEALTKHGFAVIHDKTLHDYPNYNGSYANASKTISSYLKNYPSIEIVLDLHRDGITLQDGTKIPLSVTANNQTFAKMMLVVGTDTNLEHPEWRGNANFATGIHAAAEAICPGIMRPVCIRKERFNQQLSPCSVIIEIGTNGNTREEAERSALILANAFSVYIK